MEMNDPKKGKILIVDDQQKNIQVLGSLLREEGYVIGVATNGKQTIEILKESTDYDLILLDVNMPIMDGFEACTAIRQLDNLKEIPIIFLTALVDSDSIVKGFEVGGQDYVTKPFNSSELLARVRTHLELKQSKDQLRQVNKWLEEKVAERTEELNIANSKLLQLDAAKSNFLNIISHEIRTPLNGIIGPLAILNKYKLPPEVSKWIGILDLSAKRLENFSVKALDISFFNTDVKNTLLRMEKDINNIINSQVIKLKKNAEDKNITVSMSNETNNMFSFVDEKFMKDCFYYIIDNAVKFGNKGSQVIIISTIDNGNIMISVEDEGVPFPENYDINNTQPFSNKKHIDQNPALSLFLCKQIIDAHDGQIDIMNTQNGAKVTVIIPKIESV